MTNVQPGWYPDPSGDSDQLRWYDGSKWTDEVTYVDGDGRRTPQRDRRVDAPKRPRSRLLLGGLAVGVVVVLLLGLVGGYMFMGGGGSDSRAERVQASDPSPTSSTSEQPSNTTSKKPEGPGVDGGSLSYALLGDGWGKPSKTPVQELAPSRGQAQTTQQDAPGVDGDWQAQVAVGELGPEFVYEGPADVEKTALLFASTVENKYYSSLQAVRKDQVKKPLEVSGKKAYQVTYHLTFENPPSGFAAKGETVYIVVVDNDPRPSGVFITIPDNKPELRDDATDVIDSLEMG